MKRKYLIYLIIFAIMFGFNGIVVKAKTLQQTCDYYFYDQISGQEVKTSLLMYDDKSAESIYYKFSYTLNDDKVYVSEADGVKGGLSYWNDVKNSFYQSGNAECPQYMLFQYSGFWNFFYFNDENQVKKRYKKYVTYDNGTYVVDSSATMLAKYTGRVIDDTEKEKISKQIAERTNIINGAFNFNIDNCIDESSIYPYGKCEDMLNTQYTLVNSEKNEIESLINSNADIKNDSIVTEYKNAYNSAMGRYNTLN